LKAKKKVEEQEEGKTEEEFGSKKCGWIWLRSPGDSFEKNPPFSLGFDHAHLTFSNFF
jgi:hypothetical protein